MRYADLTETVAGLTADTEIVVRSKSAEYRVIGAGLEMDLGPHIDPDDIDVNAADAPAGEQRQAVAAARMQQRDEVMLCDGQCTEHRAMLSERRTLVLTVERA